MVNILRPTTGEMGTRIDDYLNDKLQTMADMDNLDTLLETVQRQQALLKKQLEEARKASENAVGAVETQTTAIQRRSTEHQQQQTKIDRRLMALTDTESSDLASAKFASSMEQLHKLDITRANIDLLQEVNKLGNEARSNFKTSPKSALPPYLQMRSLLLAVKTGQSDATPFIDQVEKHTSALFKDIKVRFEDDLRNTLAKMGWPKKDLNITEDLLTSFNERVGLLLDLQKPDLQDDLELHTSSGTAEEGTILLPQGVMVEPLALRFQYHFYGERSTNRVDHPEYFLAHILDLLDQHNGFMTTFLQPILDRHSSQSNMADALFTDATSAFISALLPLATQKSLGLLPRITSQPQLLSHFVHELMSFDTALRDSWGYSPTPHLSLEWKGLTWSILTTHGYFSPWLKVEKDFALSRYKSIRDAPDGGEIDIDATELRTSKPTKGAQRVNDLLQTITNRYRGLSSFSDKLNFLIKVQLAIFDDYHNHLSGGLHAFIANSHTAGRLIQGQTAADASVTGIKGLESLCKVFGSAEYLEDQMSDWSNDIFFLEMWHELQDRSKDNTGPNATVGRGLTTEAVASKTSAIITAEDGEDADTGALFDETASSYRKLKNRAEAEIIRLLDTEIRQALKSFTKSSGWASLSTNTTDPAMLSPSSSLDSTLQTFVSHLGLLATVLGSGSLNRITRQVCLMIEKDLYDNLLLRHSFSSAGVAQLRRDISALEETINSSTIMPGRAQMAMRKLEQALTLLSLPLGSAESKDDVNNEGWEFGDDDADETAETPDELAEDDDDRIWDLREVFRKVFQSNESARKALVSVNCEILSASDARSLLEHRVELNS